VQNRIIVHAILLAPSIPAAASLLLQKSSNCSYIIKYIWYSLSECIVIEYWSDLRDKRRMKILDEKEKK